MTTVHIENLVHDFDQWLGNFDKYDRFRAEHGVQNYRVSRGVSNPNAVIVDLEFADGAAAAEFLPKLAQIMGTPQAKASVLEHRTPQVYELVTERAPVG